MKTEFEQLQKLQAEIDACEIFKDGHVINSWFGGPVPPAEEVKYRDAEKKIQINRLKMREILLGNATTA